MTTFTRITIITICMLASMPARAADGLSIAFIAYQNPEQVIDDVRPVITYLEKKLGMPVKYHVATNYAGVVEALKNKTADMGFMGPLQYVIAHEYAGAEPLLGELYKGKATYVSRIFVRKDSGIETLKDLKGKSIAFVDPISSSGYLYPLQTFEDSGLIKKNPEEFFKRTYFAGGDEQAIRAVLNGFVDAAGIGEFAYRLLRPEERDEVIYVGESRPLPSHCVVVREGLSKSTRLALRDALMGLNDGPDKYLLERLYGVSGYVDVDHNTFKEVEMIARKHGFLRK